jgi:hypothetical protein
MLQPVTFGPKQMIHNSIWRFPEMGVPPIAGWFLMENPSING